jgi:hypothetical protein
MHHPPTAPVVAPPRNQRDLVAASLATETHPDVHRHAHVLRALSDRMRVETYAPGDHR